MSSEEKRRERFFLIREKRALLQRGRENFRLNTSLALEGGGGGGLKSGSGEGGGGKGEVEEKVSIGAPFLKIL